MTPSWLLRMARWLRHPPSAGRVALVLAVVVPCALLVAVERLAGWPDWMTVEPVGRRGGSFTLQ
ncbi:hypothetical protein [Pseudoroseicyclus aestuarii]|uniref:Uncharacterized protein n=1 Tax=Pseudoroseicyclus aestuarii TaxID=1795041 RepID=A0A318SS48_9RHOB|nr:hypothetical protein [Pseudoroseicyclus aestuarii]PYE81186.1 hypothetical protein DFP88_10829 [Pseudoroseicyclus aestuarii]